MNTPNLDKLSLYQEEISDYAGFAAWLLNNYAIHPSNDEIHKLVHLYLGIDYEKLEEEREAWLDAVSHTLLKIAKRETDEMIDVTNEPGYKDIVYNRKNAKLFACCRDAARKYVDKHCTQAASIKTTINADRSFGHILWKTEDGAKIAVYDSSIKLLAVYITNE